MTSFKSKTLVTGGSGFIGTRLVSDLLREGADVLNIDVEAPKIEAHRRVWQRVDIEDEAALKDHIAAFDPQAIVHLAAKADFDPQPEAFFGPNVDGTRHVIEAALAHQVGRVIVTSTQYVNGPLTPFEDDLVFHPINAYGESKVEMEKLVRYPKYESVDWIIIRPTNVWGPCHPRFPREMWRYLRLGLYIHPNGAPIIRSYGYVGNVSRQIMALLECPADLVRHQVFYVGDPPMDSAILVDAFSIALRGVPVRRVPRGLLRLAGRIGDGLRGVGLKSPLFSERVVRMTIDHFARNETIWNTLNYKAICLEEAVHETVDWLRERYPAQFK